MSEWVNRKFKGKEYFGHPAGLFVLFMAEMWERMSYYGMRALLTLYMIKYLMADPERMARVLGFDTLKYILETGFGPLEVQPFASHIYGLYTGFVYLSPYFGGILADKVWGRRRSVYVGGALMAVGHFLMAFENLFIPALFFLILGNGAFKPNISTQVGSLYPEGDNRRDGAFTIFYMGINLGAFFSPFLCKNLAVAICEWMGITDPGAPWHLGFGLAGFGMIIGIIMYHLGRTLLPPENLTSLAPEKERNGILWKTVGGLLGAMAGFILILMIPMTFKIILIAAVVAGVVWSIKQVSGEMDRKKVAALVTLCIGTVFFWAIFEQQGNTLQIWADDKADWARLGLQPENYQSLNPLFIFIFAPLLDMWWNFWGARGKKSSSVRKMATGCFLIGAAFLIIPLASNFITVDKTLINLFWLTLVTLIVTMGELYLSPIGLSFVTKLAPARFMSMMMGMWLASSFLGNYLAGLLGTFYTKMSQNSFFMMFAILGCGIGVFFLIAEWKLKEVVGKDV
jgi:POT family proton-dependent oligopeptide transporter